MRDKSTIRETLFLHSQEEILEALEKAGLKVDGSIPSGKWTIKTDLSKYVVATKHPVVI